MRWLTTIHDNLSKTRRMFRALELLFVSKLTVLMELKLVVEPDLESAGSLFHLWAHSFEFVTMACAAFAVKRQYVEDSGWRWSDQILRGNIFVCFVFDW